MRMHHAALTAMALAAATAGQAQDVRTLVIDAIRAQGCTMNEAEAEVVFGGMGLDQAAVGGAVQEMIAEGEVTATEDGLRITLGPALCGAAPDPGEGAGGTVAAAWIEGRLARAEGCRLALATLAGAAEGAGIPAADFDRAVIDLAAAGAVVPEGSDIRHADCQPMPPAMDPVARIEAFGMPGFRGQVALHLMENGCRVPQAGRDAMVEAMTARAAAQMGLAEPVPPEAVAAIRVRIEEVLDNPGRAYEIDQASGDLVLLHCSP